MNDEKYGINGDQETKEKTDNKEPILYYEDNIKKPLIHPPSYKPFTCPRCGSPKFKKKKKRSPYNVFFPYLITILTCRKCGYTTYPSSERFNY